MSAKAVSEYTGKELLYRHLTHVEGLATPHAVKLDETSNFATATQNCEWLKKEGQGVIKPDQMIKRRGKHGLVKLGNTEALQQWFEKNKGQYVQVGKTTGRLSTFILEPLVQHTAKEELYVAIYSKMDHDVILFYEQGGVEIGDVDAKARQLVVPVKMKDSEMCLPPKDLDVLVGNVDPSAKNVVVKFIKELYEVYKANHFTYLEINPLVVSKGKIYILDLAAKLDETAAFLCSELWKTRSGDPVEFPAPFGRDLTPEEKYIAELDAKTGASLKLTILNRNGRVWTMVAGGGASVVFTDTICELGGASELANYGEYSGDPNESQTFEYAKTILTLMTEGKPHPQGKVLIIGGSIANFTNVAATFKGIIRAIETLVEKLREHNVTIYVRRGGPNYQGGLRKLKEAAVKLDLPIHVYGPETHMTSIVGAALGVRPLPQASVTPHTTGQFLLAPERHTGGTVSRQPSENMTATVNGEAVSSKTRSTKTKTATEVSLEGLHTLFEKNTKAVIWGQQTKAIQGMLDFDYVCKREQPSVVASTYPFTGDHRQKFYFGQKEILVPAYKSMEKAFKTHPDATVMITFASMRSVYDTVIEALHFPQLKVIAIIAEGVPENQTRKIIRLAREKGVTIIGPATVGGIKPGCFKIGNTGGMMDNILASKLYRPGSVAYVSRSGGMSNELNNILAHNTDGVFEGVAIGGDRYPGSTYTDHILRYQADPRIKMMVLLGEVGGEEEYKIVQALKEGRITKPIVTWCIGTCADYITSEVQFGHAGASANAARETAASKNAALRAAGANVPDSFDDFGNLISSVYKGLVDNGVIVPETEEPPPPVPMDYQWAKELGLIRKPASFMTSICDERGEELLYAGVPITRVLEENVGVGGVLGLLWFQKRLPDYANKFIEICLMLTADHGPAVSGAHNTIVCARAGKDLISSLVSGVLTIGDRFGGALDGAAKIFCEALDKGLSPMQFVNEQRRLGKLIPGIGHRVKSINNPDKRVEILKQLALDKTRFKQETPLFDYALKVEEITTSKKPNLILNVDGAIGTIFVDILRHSGMFTPQEAQETIEIGALNGLFVLGRSLGFIGHYLDQRRLKQGLYRHPWDDITYVMPEEEFGNNQPSL
ncbi:ATP citrate lyase citrate-binding domain-containing protein [Ditylenchus destructor]|uniref:ATP-citrate synthase n=1 Tax=Ditylenchus destructor TaxID=166010 RepID=A0AAD4R7X4_9BILA|nr:ATP citrate lyase citrate-binding domain-containing protein [Ditylenchus destructor]